MKDSKRFKEGFSDSLFYNLLSTQSMRFSGRSFFLSFIYLIVAIMILLVVIGFIIDLFN